MVYLKYILVLGAKMPKKLISFDQKTFNLLREMPNASEFVRQAIHEKLKRQNQDESDKESAKDFMTLVRKMNSMLDKNQTAFAELKESLSNHDAKFHWTYTKSEHQFAEVMKVILRNNIFAVQSLDSDWLKDHKPEIDRAVSRALNEITERIKEY